MCFFYINYKHIPVKMLKFTSSLLLGFFVNASQNHHFEDSGTIRMRAEQVRADKGGLADVIHDTSFKLDRGNPSYWFTDTSVLFEEPSPSMR